MELLDRYTGNYIDYSNLPQIIDLGRFAIVGDNEIKELTSSTYKVQDGQRIQQDILDDANKDKHEIFENIAELFDDGNFKAVPLLQGIKSGLVFGDFATQLEEELSHIEAIFHAPYSKLNRTIEKVPVSKAKRISNRSNQYLAAHTEDWYHKSLVSFRPSRILTEEVIMDEDVYENQLLIAFVTRAAKYLERRIRHTRDISSFLKKYNQLMDKYKNSTGWYKRVRRELSLAGDVYDEESGNYKSSNSDMEIATSTARRLSRLRDSLLKLRQFDLFNNVDQRRVKNIQYHDTNVLINDKHYRYLKDLWILLIKEEHSNKDDEKASEDELIVCNIRKYGASLINYAVKHVEYLGYEIFGQDNNWSAKRENCPDLNFHIDKFGVLLLSVGATNLRFVVLCSMPSPVQESQIPDNTYILYLDNEQDMNDIEDSESKKSLYVSERILPVSLRDISCVERVATIIKKELLKQYVCNTILKVYDIPRNILQYVLNAKAYIGSIGIDLKSSTFMFGKYPDIEFNRYKFREIVCGSESFKEKKHPEQVEIQKSIDDFLDMYELASMELIDKLKCFDSDCSMPINNWQCENLSYIECVCGSVLDTTDLQHIQFYKKGTGFSPDELGMDYLEISLQQPN